MPNIPHYEVYALRYAVNSAQRAAHNFIDGDPHDVAGSHDPDDGEAVAENEMGTGGADASVRKRTSRHGWRLSLASSTAYRVS